MFHCNVGCSSSTADIGFTAWSGLARGRAIWSGVNGLGGGAGSKAGNDRMFGVLAWLVDIMILYGAGRWNLNV